jgi:hypothetical protein
MKNRARGTCTAENGKLISCGILREDKRGLIAIASTLTGAGNV